MKPLLIVGAGGHGRVVLDAARAAGVVIAGFVANDLDVGSEVNGAPVLYRAPTEAPADRHSFIVAIGDQQARRGLSLALIQRGERLISVIHPRAIVSSTATVGDGSFVAANAIVGPNASVGRFCILNHGCSVDHDNRLADGVQVCPGAHLAGWVDCGNDVFIGTGAAVIPKVNVGDRAVVGAGSAVVRDVPAGVTVSGTPARDHAATRA